MPNPCASAGVGAASERGCPWFHEGLVEKFPGGKLQKMAAALMRQSRIRRCLPSALAEGWPVRRLAREARIGYGAAGEVLRSMRQRVETTLDADTAALCGESAARIRGSIAGVVEGIMGRVAAQVADLGKELDPLGLERLTRSMEAALKLADGLDGLKHRREMEKAIVRRMDGEQVASALSQQNADRYREAEDMSVEAVCAKALAEWPRAR